MADNQKKDFDFFSEEMESSIDSLFTPKRAIEIDPVTNQIREIETSPSETMTSAVTPEQIPPISPQPTTVTEKPVQEDTLKLFLEELKQALLTFEWEINENNIENVKKYVEELGSRVNLDNIVAKSIYTIILENLSLMLSNPLKIPAKGPNAIQKGLDVIYLYIEKGDDAILQLGENVSHTLALLEETKSAFIKPVKKPEEKEIQMEKPVVTPILQPIEEKAPEIELVSVEEKKSQAPSPEKTSEFDEFSLALEDSLDSQLKTEKDVSKPPSEPPKETITIPLEPISEVVPEETKIEKGTPTHEKELVLELDTEPPIPQTPQQSKVIEKPTVVPTKEEPKLVMQEPEFTKKEPFIQEPPKEEPKPSFQPTQLFQESKPVFQPKETAPPPTNIPYNDIITNQIKHFDDYINKLLNLESVCCGIPSLNKICAFAQTMRKDLENDKKILSSCLSGIFPQDLTHTFTDIVSHKKEKTEPLKPESQPQISRPEFSDTNIYITTWGGVKIGIRPNEICFDGNLSFWYNMFYGKNITRMNDIPLKYLKQWPWSKMSSVFKGELLSLSEDKLSSMTLPLKKSPRHPLGIPQNPNIIVLYKDGKGFVIFTEQTLQIKSTKDYKWFPQEENDFIGFLEKDDEKIKIISLQK